MMTREWPNREDAIFNMIQARLSLVKTIQEEDMTKILKAFFFEVDDIYEKSPLKIKKFSTIIVMLLLAKRANKMCTLTSWISYTVLVRPSVCVFVYVYRHHDAPTHNKKKSFFFVSSLRAHKGFFRHVRWELDIKCFSVTKYK